MKLRSFSLSKIVPVEIINLIIQESSRSTLLAWSLVSLGCLSVAGPLLNEHVQIPSQKYLLRILQRMTLPEDDLLLFPLPRLSSSLSLKNVRRLSFLTRPKASAEDWHSLLNAPSQPRRRSLDLEFRWKYEEKKLEQEISFRVVLLPRLMRLLRPGSLSGNTSTPYTASEPYHITSVHLQSYATLLSFIPSIPIDNPSKENQHPSFLALSHGFAIVINQQSRRDIFEQMLDMTRARFALIPDPSAVEILERLEVAWAEVLEEDAVWREELERREEPEVELAAGEEPLEVLRAAPDKIRELEEILMATIREATDWACQDQV